ncbi:MAG: ribosome biogenesis GTP-binding protein YihA/YsxC [Saprospiraceae bacterium]|nr:ribosome biogenesis GTP-binding protein YihA/YsxC [Saprospiraceae bacterium]|tara:strand:- start:127 stop:753 length:627 start_codon:yes stop_codon:yes gene_type:complete
MPKIIPEFKIKSIDFKGSFVKPHAIQETERPEYAFIGRSNVGKSSLINTLIERKNFARTSNTPGKTQALNLYVVNNQWNIMDLPGYGYARISKVQRAKWRKMIDQYLSKRPNLVCVLQLVDTRIPPQDIDLEFANWLGENTIPFVIVFTKSDKLKPLELEKNVSIFKNKMLETWESLPSLFITSSETNKGRDEVLNFILETNQNLGGE